VGVLVGVMLRKDDSIDASRDDITIKIYNSSPYTIQVSLLENINSRNGPKRSVRGSGGPFLVSTGTCVTCTVPNDKQVGARKDFSYNCYVLVEFFQEGIIDILCQVLNCNLEHSNNSYLVVNEKCMITSNQSTLD
jgi:hypothetical protein